MLLNPSRFGWRMPAGPLWLDASDSLSYDGSNLIGQWSDKSGNANHLVQATGASKPSRVTSQFTAGAVNCSGSTGMTLTTPINLVGKTVFLVVYWEAPAAARRSVGLAAGAIDTAVDQVNINSGTGPNYSGSVFAGHGTGASWNAYLQSSNANLVTAGKHVICFDLGSTPNATDVYLDGTLIGETIHNGSTSWAITVDRLGLQSVYQGGTSQHAEIGVCNALSSGERAAVFAALNAKWGV